MLLSESWYDTGALIACGSQQRYAIIAGCGTPTVIFEAGLSSTAAAWSAVMPALQQETRCCAYDRAGVGRSPAGPPPRTAQQLADELLLLLQHPMLPPPYVLVGHSFGGMVIQLLAAQRPSLIAGLVLVDTPHPLQQERMAALLPAGAWDAAMQPWNSEGVDLATSFAQLQAAALPHVPTTILTAGQNSYSAAWPHEALEALRLELQHDLARRLPHAQHRVVPESGHQIALERPDVVSAAIRALLARPDAIIPSALAAHPADQES